MAKIVRNNQKVFGDNAAVNNFSQFGNSSITTKDVGAMQNGNWENGWSSGGVNINGVITPQFQEFNTLSYVTTSQIAYLQQEGIAEYHAETEYHKNSIVKQSGTSKLYVSLVNNNTGNAINSGGNNAFWKFAGDITDIVAGSKLPNPNGQPNNKILKVNNGQLVYSDLPTPLNLQRYEETIQTWNSTSILSVNVGFGRPDIINLYAIATVANNGYSVGDKVLLGLGAETASNLSGGGNLDTGSVKGYSIFFGSNESIVNLAIEDFVAVQNQPSGSSFRLLNTQYNLFIEAIKFSA